MQTMKQPSIVGSYEAVFRGLFASYMIASTLILPNFAGLSGNNVDMPSFRGFISNNADRPLVQAWFSRAFGCTRLIAYHYFAYVFLPNIRISSRSYAKLCVIEMIGRFCDKVTN